MARLWVKTVSFETVQVGDQLPILLKWETRDSIVRFAPPGAGCEAEPPAGASISEATLRAYVSELLQKGFPPERLAAAGSQLRLESLLPVRAGEIISLSGQVVDKGEAGGLRLVHLEIAVEDQAGQLVAQARAVVPL